MPDVLPAVPLRLKLGVTAPVPLELAHETPCVQKLLTVPSLCSSVKVGVLALAL